MTYRLHSTRRAGVAALALALAGCGSMAPTYERPAAPVAPVFPLASAPTTTTPAADIDWQQFFTDPAMKRLIDLSLDNNRDLRIAALNIETARAQARLRGADLWPSVGLGVSGSRTPGSNGSIASVYSAGLTVTAYELDFFGRLRSLNDTAAAQFLSAVEARKAVQISLVAAVANGWLALRADDDLLRVTQLALASREDSYRLSKLRFDNGATSQLDLRQAESLLESARVSLAQLRRQRLLDENALVLLVGQPLPTDLPAALPMGEAALLPEVPAGLPSEVLTRRPDVRQAEQQLIAANANIGAARAAFFPRISLTGSVGAASNHLSDLFSGGQLAWSFVPQLLQPIFDAGRNQANLDLAQASRDVAVAQYERAVQSAFREVADALAGRATLNDQLRAQTAQVRAEEDRLRLADLRYRNGASSFLDVLDAQRSLFVAQQAEVQVRAQAVQNLVTLYKVLGGGWTEPPAAP